MSRHVCDHDPALVHVLHGTDPDGQECNSELLPSIWTGYQHQYPGFPFGDGARITLRPMTADEADYDAMRKRRRALALRYAGSIGAPPDFAEWLRARQWSDLANGIRRD